MISDREQHAMDRVKAALEELTGALREAAECDLEVDYNLIEATEISVPHPFPAAYDVTFKRRIAA